MVTQFTATLHYHKLGHGPRTVLAFHGIGQDGLTCFKPFEAYWKELYTIYAIDLPFHGRSAFVKGQIITKALWKNVLQDFLAANDIERFDIAGFSMGGRFALATLEAFPDRIDHAFLIAPDGISEHPLYLLASRFSPARSIFGWSMQHPNAFFSVCGLLQKIGLVNASLYRFVQQVLNTPEKRQTVYHSWVNFRKLRFDIPVIYKMASSNDVSIYLFVGQYDKLLKPAAVQKLATLLPANHYIVLKSGHTQLVEQAASWICALFK
ncbi:alpha/beta hydrolase [Dyadobacter sp. LJ53]|uniref:alpha/beta hydrolase n=1 Tax=Dyadobacter chenwenxiniae TaxID=2906456 RepID=UPI001F18774C|nr:alpha/beta hydrolase [Dyadobacter chenwenxiniae]MCF0049607.1 alpha/beta hydrolase [Dyadobacter chenwenxiniae]